jgi:steroid delta-isomerase-like uncharacterized protein
MSDPATIARQYTDAWNRRDWAKMSSLFHSDYTYTGGDGQVQKGPEAGLAVGQMFAGAFPDGKINIKEIHVCGNTALVEFVGTGTHKGDLMGIAPTGRSISIPVCDILDTKDGKIVAEREYFDMAHMMQQLGVMPAPAHA